MTLLPVTVLSGFLGAGKTTLLTPDEFASGAFEWLKFPDPLPRWDVQRAPTGAQEVNA